MHYIMTDSLVLTQNGYKPVQFIDNEDLVFTSLGKWAKIKEKQIHDYKGVIVSIYSEISNMIIKTTSEHPFLTKTVISTGFGPNEFKISDKTSWTPASSLKVNKHLLCVPIEQTEQSISINIEVNGIKRASSKIDWFMVGYYFGKGGRTFEVEFIPPGWSILKEFTFNPDENGTVCNYIPEWVQRLPKDDIDTFIRGFEKFSTSRGYIIVMNENVAMSIQRLYAKLHRVVEINVNKGIVFLKEIKKHIVVFDDKYMYVPIEYILDEQMEAKVYGIDVEDDQSYVIENIISKC